MENFQDNYVGIYLFSISLQWARALEEFLGSSGTCINNQYTILLFRIEI